jgi:hypothetical protein
VHRGLSTPSCPLFRVVKNKWNTKWHVEVQVDRIANLNINIFLSVFTSYHYVYSYRIDSMSIELRKGKGFEAPGSTQGTQHQQVSKDRMYVQSLHEQIQYSIVISR